MAGSSPRPRARARAPRTTSSTMIAPTKTASPSVPSGPQARSPSASAAAVTTTARTRGSVKRSRIVAHDAVPQGSAGPTPIRKRSATKIGTVTVLNHGAPTLIVSPLVAATSSGSSVPNSTAKVRPRNRTLLSRKADSRLTVPDGRPPPTSSGRRQTSRVSEPASATRIPARNHGPDRRLREGVHAGHDAGPGEERADQGEHERCDDEGARPDAQAAASLGDHRRVDEGGGRQPRQQGRVLDRIPRPVAAPAEHLVAPPCPGHDAERQEGPRDERPAPHDAQPLLVEPAGRERRNAERERDRPARCSRGRAAAGAGP